MMNKKIITLLTAGALISTIAIGVIFKNNKVESVANDKVSQSILDSDEEVDDLDDLDMNDELDEEEVVVESEEDLNRLKSEFTSEYGSEDTFIKVYEDNEFIEEVNGAQGIIRYTDKETNEVDEHNYFQELDKKFKFSQLSSKEEKIQFLKDEFRNKYGNEDIFKTIYEDEYCLEEVNGAQGIIRYTDKYTNTIEETNNFEEIENYVNGL